MNPLKLQIETKENKLVLNDIMSMLGHNLKGFQNLQKLHFMNEQKFHIRYIA